MSPYRKFQVKAIHGLLFCLVLVLPLAIRGEGQQLVLPGPATAIRTTDLINVKLYGAIGNGMTDDTAAITNALNIAAGGSVYFPPGTYLVSRAISNSAANTTLQGAGQSSIIKQIGTPNYDLLTLSGNNATVRDLQFQGSAIGESNGQFGLLILKGNVGAIVERCLFTGTTTTTGYVVGLWLQNCQRCRVAANRFENGVGQSNFGVSLYVQTPATFGGNLASAATLTLPSTGNVFRVTGITNISTLDEAAHNNPSLYISLKFAGSLSIVNGKAINTGSTNYMTTAEPVTSYPTDWVLFQKTGTQTWRLVSSSLKADNPHPAGSNYNTIEGNYFASNLDGSNHGLQYLLLGFRGGGFGNIIRGNRFVAGQSAQISQTANIKDALTTWDGNIITENIFYNLAPKPSVENQEAAIEIIGAARHNIIRGNTIIRSGRNGIWVGEDGTVQSNRFNVVSENTVRESQRRGIVNTGSYNLVSGNTVYESSQAAAGTDAGIWMYGPTGQDNQFSAAVNNILIGSRFQAYGIKLDDNNGSNFVPLDAMISGNLIPKNQTGIIFDGGRRTNNLQVLRGEKVGMTNNTPTSFARIHLPNAITIARFTVDYIINSQSRQRLQTGQLHITAGRTDSGTNSVAAITSVYSQAIQMTGAETLTVTFSMSAVSGAYTTKQTFDVQVTANSSAGSAGHLQYALSLISDRFDGSLGEGQHAWAEPL